VLCSARHPLRLVASVFSVGMHGLNAAVHLLQLLDSDSVPGSSIHFLLPFATPH
jgi:hypothetical protein